jgi:hypothetical protein
MLYYCMYFNLDVSFYMFPIIFWIRQIVKVTIKRRQRQIFWYGGGMYVLNVTTFFCLS